MTAITVLALLVPPVCIFFTVPTAEQAACAETAAAVASTALKIAAAHVEGAADKLYGDISTGVFRPVVPLAANSLTLCIALVILAAGDQVPDLSTVRVAKFGQKCRPLGPPVLVLSKG